MSYVKGGTFEDKTGGAAFPSTQYVNGLSPTGHSQGMTLRDYFAAKAMEGMILKYPITEPSARQKIAAAAYRMADTTGFEKAWRHRSKNSVRHLRAPLKKAHSRLNRREGRLNLMDACSYKLNERNVT
jgi:hypothetical protein